MSGYIQGITLLKSDKHIICLESDAGGTLQNHDPFVFVLIIPEPGTGNLTQGYNTFHPDAGSSQNFMYILPAQIGRHILQQIIWVHRSPQEYRLLGLS